MRCETCSKVFDNSSINLYILHLKSHRNLTQYTCDHCTHIYENLSSLKRHLCKVKSQNDRQNIISNNRNNSNIDVQEHDSNIDIHDSNIDIDDSNIDTNNLNINTNNSNIVSNYNTIINIESNDNQNESAVSKFKNDIINNMLSLLADFSIPRLRAFEISKNSIEMHKNLLTLMKNNTNQESNIINFINEFLAMLSNLQVSEYQFIKYLSNNNLWLPSTSLKLKEQVNLTDLQNLKKEKFDMQYVNIILLLQKIFSNALILNTVVTFIESIDIESEFLTHVYQSTLFQNILTQEKTDNLDFDQTLYIPYSIYSDEFDPKNSLGSHGGSYSVGHVYIILHCFPPHLASKLDFIFFVMAFFSGDKKEFGIEVIFSQLINDMSFLERTKLEISHPNYKFLSFKFINLMGDNKDVHEVLGFTGNFCADVLCRFCYVKRNERNKQTVEQPQLMRDLVKYASDLSDLDTQKSGIKFNSPFNRICPRFHVVSNFYVDIMHDVLLGSLKYDISFALYELTCSKGKSINLDLLNKSIKNIQYGANYKNTIDTITSARLKNGNLKGSASELLNLIIHLPIILYKLGINLENQFYKVILSAKKLLSMLLQHTIGRNFHKLVKHEISQHLELFITVLGPMGYSMKYKHHLMTHYSMVMHYIGPLVNFTCFRTEAKHMAYKKYSQSINNCQNLVLTFAKKNQFHLAHFLNKPPIDHCIFETFSSVYMNKKDIEVKYSLQIDIDLDYMATYRKIKYYGTIFNTNDIINLNKNDVYGQLKLIASTENSFFFIIEYVNIIYMELVDCFEIIDYTDTYEIINMNSLESTLKPFNVFIIKIEDKHIFNCM